MSMAIIGGIVAIGGTTYSILQQNAAIRAANSARPAAFVPVDIAKTAQLALDADKAGYKISDLDWERRFPLLKKGRDFNIEDAGLQLRGGTSKTVADAMSQSGLTGDLGNTEFEKSRNLGMPILALEQRDRNYFQKQLAMNPQRAAGLSGQDVARIAITNTGGQNNYNQGIFQSRIAQYNTQVNQALQNQNAGVAGLGALADLIPQRNQSTSGVLDPSYYGSLTTGQGAPRPYGG